MACNEIGHTRICRWPTATNVTVWVTVTIVQEASCSHGTAQPLFERRCRRHDVGGDGRVPSVLFRLLRPRLGWPTKHVMLWQPLVRCSNYISLGQELTPAHWFHDLVHPSSKNPFIRTDNRVMLQILGNLFDGIQLIHRAD